MQLVGLLVKKKVKLHRKFVAYKSKILGY